MKYSFTSVVSLSWAVILSTLFDRPGSLRALPFLNSQKTNFRTIYEEVVREEGGSGGMGVL